MEYRAELEQAVAIGDVAPAIWWGAPSRTTDDGITTLTLGIVYTARGHLPAEARDELEALGAARLAGLIGENPERLRSVVLLGPNPLGDAEPPIELTDWQYRSVLAIAREVYPVFGAELPFTTREVGRVQVSVRLPPDGMIVRDAAPPRRPAANE
jgi:hypothetical protein